jgi:hypothetical protein
MLTIRKTKVGVTEIQAFFFKEEVMIRVIFNPDVVLFNIDTSHMSIIL